MTERRSLAYQAGYYLMLTCWWASRLACAVTAAAVALVLEALIITSCLLVIARQSNPDESDALDFDMGRHRPRDTADTDTDT